MFKKVVLLCFGLLVVLAAGLWLNWQIATPSHDRNWQTLYARQPTVEQNGDLYEVTQVRNWTYGEAGETQEWMTVTLDPDQLTRVYFIEEPFGDIRAIAHTMLAFEFADGSAYVASVEARREVGEGFGGLKAGILPMHEYLVYWTTERDMYGNSTFFTGDDLYLFPLDLPPEAAKAVLLGMLAETETLETTPRWYNTFFSNCTNVLARAVNSVAEAAVPWDLAWYLPGYAAEFLYDQGVIAGEGSFAEVRAASHLTPRVAPAYDITDPVAFSRAIRE
ncbi:MAG: lipoprotein N-acyltransferase Lnb domain-containing protein [Paracoccaceae bacterium]